jgi:hypothetical protein
MASKEAQGSRMINRDMAFYMWLEVGHMEQSMQDDLRKAARGVVKALEKYREALRANNAFAELADADAVMEAIEERVSHD